MTRLSRPWCGLIDISLLLENLSACFCSAGWYRRVPASRAIFAFRVIFVLFLVLTRVKNTLQYLCMIETSETEQTYLLRSVVWKSIGYCLYASLYLILSFLCLILTQFPILCALEEHSCSVDLKPGDCELVVDGGRALQPCRYRLFTHMYCIILYPYST